MRRELTRLALIGLHLFLGITAIYGGIDVVPTLPLEWLVGTPFPDYTIPALALAVVGGGALGAAAMLVFDQRLGAIASLLVGLAIVIFEIVETTVIGLDVWLHALGLTSVSEKGGALLAIEGMPSPLGIPLPLWLQPFYVLLGLAIVALALRLWARQPRGMLHPRPVGR